MGITPPAPADKEQQQHAGNEIMLILSNRFAKVEDPEVVARNVLYNETKRQVFTVIRVQQDGVNLVALMDAAVRAVHEQTYDEFVKREAQKQRGGMGSSHSLNNIASAVTSSKQYESLSNIARGDDGNQ